MRSVRANQSRRNEISTETNRKMNSFIEISRLSERFFRAGKPYLWSAKRESAHVLEWKTTRQHVNSTVNCWLRPKLNFMVTIWIVVLSVWFVWFWGIWGLISGKVYGASLLSSTFIRQYFIMVLTLLDFARWLSTW